MMVPSGGLFNIGFPPVFWAFQEISLPKFSFRSLSLLYVYIVITEWVSVTVTLLTPIREDVGSHFSQDTGYPKGFRGFPRSLQTNAG
jgi:hypothetical protein